MDNNIIDGMPNNKRMSLLGKLLDWRLSEGSILAFRAHMGQAPSYISSVPLAWVAEHVKFASDRKMLAGIVDERAKAFDVKKVKKGEFTYDHIVQRRPDWTRQMPMSVYLAAWEKHKFPPLLVEGHQQWVGDENSENWANGNKAVRESVNTIPLGRGFCELIVDDETDFFALDGQHRVMAILGLKTLIDDGKLPAYDADKNPKKQGGINLQNVAQAIWQQGGEKLEGDAIRDKLREVMSEEIGIEIIPSAVKGEERAKARFRLRSVFVDVNENAKKPTRGESILLDERNAFRVVAREVMVHHPLLNGRVYVKMRNLPKTSRDYTTLGTLAQIAELHLGYKEYAEWKNSLIPGKKSSGHVRPKDEADVDQGTHDFAKYFDALERLPSHARMVREKNLSASVFREKKEDNIFFRPVAQMAFAEASARLECDHGISLKDAVSELIRQEQRGQLKLRDPKTPWYGVIWDPVRSKMRATAGARNLCMRLFVHLLGGESEPDDLVKLRNDFAKSRQTTDDKTKAMNLEGESVPMEEVSLPAPWR